MKAISRRWKRKHVLAAPIVVTAMLSSACEGRTYTNPARPQHPEATTTAPDAPPDGSAEPTGEPVTTAEPSVSPDVGNLPAAPTDGSGSVERQPDGTCLYVYPMPDTKCPPKVKCNPGPPRAPLKVKCPDGKSI